MKQPDILPHILPPGSTIGILGGGQLGQMLSLAAHRLGLHTHIYTDSENSPAIHAARHYTIGDYNDPEKLAKFSSQVDLVTYEFENIPVKTVKALIDTVPVFPGVKPLNVAQDRLVEKTFISGEAKVPVTEFADIKSVSDVKDAVKKLGLPLILKTRRLGYDGKGQVIIRDQADIETAFKALGNVPIIAEQFVPFGREISVICARSTQGEIKAYPIIENVHRDGILHQSTAPAKTDNPLALEKAINILTALDYIGVLAVEFFELKTGELLVNEIAPRVHNSGHWTQNAGCTDQFELHIRAICGWPLGNTTPKHSVVMENLIGEDIHAWADLADQPNVHIHHYGKSDARAGRKMGHINRVI